MIDTSHSSIITNSLKSSAINVFIKERGKSRRGALPGDVSLLKPGDTSELTDFTGKDDIALIIISELVPGAGAKQIEGLHVGFGDQLKLKNSEVRRHVKDTFEFIYYFSHIASASLKSGDSQIDVDVQHPTDDDI
ncbi:hypothetical protein [Rhodohalobacter sp. 8-1]|uniref:hypothetical protein n=1 Tax=Rhodohalobacter sp. 8-1 TaxID=3131972 RepID=UPI0030EDF4AD